MSAACPTFRWLVFATAFLWCVACLRAADATGEFTAEEISRGRKLFTLHCARCHGMHGLGGTGPNLARPTLTHATDNQRLLAIIEGGVPGTAMPGWRNNLVDRDKRALMAFVRSLGTATEAPVPGDAARGKQLFARAACTQCHTVAGEGGVKGPDLTAVGLRRGAERLRKALLEPGAERITGEDGFFEFLPVRVVSSTGQELEGLRVNEDTFTIQLRDLDNRLHSVRKADARVLEKGFARSVMPSFASVFNPAELDDLVAYLASLRGKP